MIQAKTVNIIGPGKVGQTLLRRMASTGVLVNDVAGRSLEAAQRAVAAAGIGRAVAQIKDMRPADIWLLTVPDTAIAPVARALADVQTGPSIALHCSGFFPATEMAALGYAGWSLASAHPVLSFADPVLASQRFAGSFCGVEGDDGAVATVSDLFSRLGAEVFPIRSDAKALYHGAAVFANNFTTVLQGVAHEAWAEADVPAETVGALHEALLRSTVENVLERGAADGLTGPAARGDTAVVTAQGAAFADWDSQVGEVYALLSAMAARLKTNGSVRE